MEKVLRKMWRFSRPLCPAWSDHKKAYQEYLKEKTCRTVVVYFAMKKKVFIKHAVIKYVAMCCQSLATLGCMHILMYNIFVHQSGVRVRQIARAE
jgi:hypothetical protein